MRQFFSIRYWAAIGAVLGLFAVLAAVFNDSPVASQVATPSASSTASRRIDLIAPVYGVQAEPVFRMSPRGTTTTELRLYIDSERVMVIYPGTPGEIRCAELDEIGKCVVVADLLGEAVVWFTLIPSEARATVTLPAPEEILDDGWLLLANGWQVRHAVKVTRRCEQDIASLTEFIREFGDTATSTYDMVNQQVIRVTCPAP